MIGLYASQRKAIKHASATALAEGVPVSVRKHVCPYVGACEQVCSGVRYTLALGREAGAWLIVCFK